MPPPPSIPRETRSQSRKSRVSSDGVESVEAPGSTQKAITNPRRKPNVRAKPSSNYGAAVDSQAPAQKQAVKLAKREAIGRIEDGVGAAIERSATLTTNNTKGLTAVAEEEEHEAVEDNVSQRDEELAVLDNRDGNEGMDYHHTASDLAGSKSFGSEAHLNSLLNRQNTRAVSQQPADADLDATSTQPVHSNQNDMPSPLHSPIHHPTLTNIPITTAPVSHGVITTPWTWKWIWLALVISLLVSLCSAALSTLRYQQMTTSLSEFQNDCGKKVSSIIPNRLIQRLDKLEEQVAHLTENAVMKDNRPFQINWFSYDLGARVNPYLSSPSTRSPKLPIKSRWSFEWKDIRSAWKSSSSSSSSSQQQRRDDNSPLLPRRRSAGPNSSSTSINPNTVLTPYTKFEPGYCAPFGGRGKLQLAVLTPRPITPTELVIEHFHKDKVLSIGSAPKEIELWIEIADEADASLREEVRRRIREIYPDIFSRESTQKDRFLDPKMALGKTWVPVGRWIYRISSASSSSSSFRDKNNVQYFKIPLDLASMGVVVKQQVVRVNSNWGDVDRTCLVRVGLHGHDPSAPAEYLEDDDGY